MTIISIFNPKGGVAKTTTTLALGWEIASGGKIVVIVDCDAQCNLSQIVLQNVLAERDLNFEEYCNINKEHDEDCLNEEYGEDFLNEQYGEDFPATPNNLRDALLPIINDNLGAPICPANLYTKRTFVHGGKLLLLAGHPDITRFEEKLGMAYSSSGMIAPRSLNAFADMLHQTKEVCL